MTKVKETMKLKINTWIWQNIRCKLHLKTKQFTSIGYYANTKQNSRVMNKLLTSQRLFKAS